METKPQNKQVLLVDDEPEIRDSFCLHLQLNGYDVSVASDGLEALYAMTKKDFAVVIIDIRMPVMDGLEATKFLRACEQGKHHHLKEHSELAQTLHSRKKNSRTPVVACTANFISMEALQEAGIDDQIKKPFMLTVLYDVLEKYAG